MRGDSVSIPGEFNMGNAKMTFMHRNRSAAAAWKPLLLAGCVAFAGAGRLMAQTCNDITASDFKKVPLATGLDSPLKMKIATDGRIFFIERSGAVMMLHPGTGASTPVKLLTINVANGYSNEDGVRGIALDPKFDVNNWIYL